MSDQRPSEEQHGHAPGAGPPPPRLNPTPPPPRLNLLAVLLVLGLVAGAGGLGMAAVKADKKRKTDAKEKIAAQQASDARREGRSADATPWRNWADLTCQSVYDRSVVLGPQLEAVGQAKDPGQTVVSLGDAFVTLSDLYRAWSAGMTATPKPEVQKADAQVGLYVTYFGNLADQVRRLADSAKALDPATVSADQADELLDRAHAIDRSLVELPDAADAYHGLDEAPACQDVGRQVETKV